MDRRCDELEEIAKIKAEAAKKRRRSEASRKAAATRARKKLEAAAAAPRRWEIFEVVEILDGLGTGMTSKVQYNFEGSEWAPETPAEVVIADLERRAALAEPVPDPDDPECNLAVPLPDRDWVIVKGTEVVAVVLKGEPGRGRLIRIR